MGCKRSEVQILSPRQTHKPPNRSGRRFPFSGTPQILSPRQTHKPPNRSGRRFPFSGTPQILSPCSKQRRKSGHLRLFPLSCGFLSHLSAVARKGCRTIRAPPKRTLWHRFSQIFLRHLRIFLVTADIFCGHLRAYLLANLRAFEYPCIGSGKVPVGFPVFKTGGGSRCGPRWVRPPSTPALF